jgi:amidophosphoribosyltransferase
MCGIVGIVSNGDPVAPDLVFSLRQLQHRGKDSAGIATYDKDDIVVRKGIGTVEIVFGANGIHEIQGTAGIGHVRYSTAGGGTVAHGHPYEGSFLGKKFALGHNGNLVQTESLFERCKRAGYPELQHVSSVEEVTDTQLIVLMIAHSNESNFKMALSSALDSVEGTYSIVALYDGVVYACRDYSGNRPLVIGSGRGISVVVSESAVCDTLGVSFEREISPGEIVSLSPGKYPDKCRMHSENLHNSARRQESLCSFEHIYFLRPDTIFDGKRAQIVRERLGRTLWEEHKHKVKNATAVIPVPDSGLAAAIGFSEASGKPLKQALIRYHYSGRTFIDLHDKREKGLQIKFGIVPEHIQGKSVCVVDDSLVRATTMRKIVSMLKGIGGAAEVIVCISAPLYIEPCYYGIDTYRVKNELAAKRHRGDIEGIRKEIGADALYYLSIEGLRSALQDVNDPRRYCYACFTGEYPIPIV